MIFQNQNYEDLTKISKDLKKIKILKYLKKFLKLGVIIFSEKRNDTVLKVEVYF